MLNKDALHFRSEMILYVQERSQTGATRRLTATEVFNFFNQSQIQTQLVQHLAVEKVFPKTGMTAEQLKQYLDNPPAGKFTVLIRHKHTTKTKV